MLPAIGSSAKSKTKPALVAAESSNSSLGDSDRVKDDEGGGGSEDGSDGEGSEAGRDVQASQPIERVRSGEVRLINVERESGIDTAMGGRFLGDDEGEAGMEFRSLDDEADAERPRTRDRVPSRTGTHPGGNPGANLKSISHRCHPILVAFVWKLTNETIYLPLGYLQGACAATFQRPNLLASFPHRARCAS